MNADLVVRLQASADTLTTRVCDEMYRDPFWDARFGERGRQFSRQDGQFHISYLVQALVAGDPGVFVRYAQWLQSVLTTRGMSSRHIDQNFHRLAVAIADTVDDPGPALDCLSRGRQALLYAAGAARAIQLQAEHLAARTCVALLPGHAGAEQRGAAADRLMDEAASLWAYLADALALNRPAVFVEHVQWRSGAPFRAAAPPVAAVLRAMAQALDHAGLTDDVRRDAGAVVERAIAGVDRPAGGASGAPQAW